MARPLRFPMLAALSWALTCGFAASASAQDDLSDVVVRAERVAPGVHVLTGRGGNIGVSSGSDGIAIVDDQYAPLHEKIVAALAEIQPGPVRFVLNTHWHGDHTGGNEAFGEAGALIVAHDAVRRRMSSEQFLQALDRRVPASPPGALPVLTFAADTTLHWNGAALHVIHVPRAHTDGDAIVHWQAADVVHLGDLFFAGRYPFIDLDSGGSLEGMIQGVDFALGLTGTDTRVIPGHGPLSDRAGLVEYRNVLVAARDRISAAISDGLSVEEVVAARPLAEYDDAWGAGFITAEGFLKIAYASLSAN